MRALAEMKTVLAVGGLTASLLLAGACASPRVESAYAPDSFDTSVERAPTVATLHATARVMASQGRDSQCELVLHKLIDEHPDFLPAYNELAELHMRYGAIESAAVTLEMGLERAPEDGVMLNNLGMCRLLQKHYEEALDCFTRACASNPEDARSRSNMATSLGLLGRHDEALALFYQVLPPAEAHHNVAVLCRSIGDEERARLEFARAADPKLRR
jgi:Flp pilus assembly protein TadD